MTGLEWIRLNPQSPPIKVLNVSLVRPGHRDDNIPLRDKFALVTVAPLNIVTVVAAGNDPTREVSQVVPAAYRSVMAIANTTAALGTDDPCTAFLRVAADTAAWDTTDGAFDLFMKSGVTVSVPGEEKEDKVGTPTGGCARQIVGLELLTREGGVTRRAGTSFSSPHVAGVAALMKQQTPTLTLDPARTKIRSSADRQGVVPLDSSYIAYTFDGEREGIVWAPGALQ